MTTDDDMLERLLKTVGTREALPADLDAKWRRMFEAALRPAIRRRRRRVVVRALGAFAIAASALLVWNVYTPGRTPLGKVTFVTAEAGMRADVLPTVGAEVRSGDVVHTPQGGRVFIDYRGVDVRVDAETELVVGVDHLRLAHGSVYVDSAPERKTPHVVVTTPHGRVSHLGTQFLVKSRDRGMFAAVREGAIVVETARERREVAATADAAAVVEVEGGSVRTGRTTRRGEIWSWINDGTTAPASLNGRSAEAYLAWYARETGRHVEYLDAHSRETASRALLHGASQVPLNDALEVLSSITRLDVALVDDGATVRVRRASERDQHADGRDDG